MSDVAPWPVRLARKSVAKRRKLAALVAALGDTSGKTCLDLGSDNGAVSWLLRERGGTWHSADVEPAAVASIRATVGERVHELARDGSLPFPDEAFDVVAIVDLLEHLEDDARLARETARVLKPGGLLVANTPRCTRVSPVRGLRLLLGQTDARHGHVRPGYTLDELRVLFGGDFQLLGARTYSKCFSELIDAGLTFAFHRVKRDGGGKGVLVTGEDLARHERKFRLYAAAYPFLRAFAALDALVPLPGHQLCTRWRRSGA